MHTNDITPDATDAAIARLDAALDAAQQFSVHHIPSWTVDRRPTLDGWRVSAHVPAALYLARGATNFMSEYDTAVFRGKGADTLIDAINDVAAQVETAIHAITVREVVTP